MTGKIGLGFDRTMYLFYGGWWAYVYADCLLVGSARQSFVRAWLLEYWHSTAVWLLVGVIRVRSRGVQTPVTVVMTDMAPAP